MRLSKYFLPVLKENPKEAQILSHRLMLRAGMIQQSSAGIYSWLPLGLKVLSKIEKIVREEQDKAGALEIKMPTIQPAEIWKESGRYNDYGLEMLRIKDRHDRAMLYGPTNEEQVTDICRAHVKSYRALPLNLYHIQWKFRDEVRPRFGVMRGREFLMKDAYSFDFDEKTARAAYNKMFVSYLKTFARMGLTAIPMEADTGPIGGDMSHEFIILADTGESGVYFHKDWLKTDLVTDIDYSADLEPIINKFTKIYARTDEKHDPINCPIEKKDLIEGRGVEVGHIFYFGTKYSKSMGASVSGPDGKPIDLHMGSYGIGVSRLVGGIIEASHDNKGIIWPEEVSPFDVAIINLKSGNQMVDDLSEKLYQLGLSNKHDCLFDDSNYSAGEKLATMDLIGIPWQLVIGPKGLKRNIIELKNRKSGRVTEITPEQAMKFVSSQGSLSLPQPDEFKGQ